MLIHGTFAGDPADVGPKWWQKGSATWLRLEQTLPSGIDIADVFHWDNGPNSYRARVHAGGTLLKRLLELEGKGQGYHLVGHSHGGSVIWECLRQATFARFDPRTPPDDYRLLDLPNLMSWTTIGTPFIDFAPWVPGAKSPNTETRLKKPRKHRNVLLRSADWSHRIFGLFTWMWVAIGIVGPILAFWAILEDYRSSADMPAVALFIVPLIPLLFIPISLVAGAYLIRIAEATQASTERLLTSICVQKFGPKWLGIYSQHDEAIGVIKASINFHAPLIVKRVNTTPTFYSDNVYRSIHWLRRRMNSIYNMFVPRLGNRFVSKQVSRSVQGSDRPSSVAVAVRTHPGWSDSFFMPLPEHIDAKLVALANQRAAEMIPQLRSLLYGFNDGALRVAVEKSIDPTSGLVHNSYFDADEIVGTIVHHISMTTSTQTGSCEESEPTYSWIRAFKEEFARHIDYHPLEFFL